MAVVPLWCPVVPLWWAETLMWWGVVALDVFCGASVVPLLTD
ncbi:MAG: hypothetical protein AAFX01_14370 [Cyanobacteria bacterium J06638_28]